MALARDRWSRLLRWLLQGGCALLGAAAVAAWWFGAGQVALALQACSVLLSAAAGYCVTSPKLRVVFACVALAIALPGMGSVVVGLALVPLAVPCATDHRIRIERHSLPSRSPLATLDLSDLSVAGSQQEQEGLQAVGALRVLPPRLAVPALRVYLSSPRDEVRLLAYALIERCEQKIRREIERVAEWAEACAEQDDLFAAARQLAHLHWELAESQIAMDIARDLALKEASAWATRALDQRPGDATLWLLRARCELQRGERSLARHCLEVAGDCGAHPSLLAGVFAELRLRERQCELLPSGAARGQPT